MAKLLIKTLISLAFLAFTEGRSSGPPLEACLTMVPKHDGIVFTKNNVVINAVKNLDGSLSVSCKLADDSSFKGEPTKFSTYSKIHILHCFLLGFLIQVRSSIGINIGSFDEVAALDPKKYICGHGHTNAGLKTISKGTWRYGIPGLSALGDLPNYLQPLSIKCTLVKNFNRGYHGEIALPVSLTSHLGKLSYY